MYDEMFGEAWRQYAEVMGASDAPSSPRALLRLVSHTYFDFNTADLARHQLMNDRVIPDFTPTAENYGPAVQAYARMQELLAGVGSHDAADVDLITAVISGLIHQHWANDPGGTRWAGLVDRALDMYADALGLPEDTT